MQITPENFCSNQSYLLVSQVEILWITAQHVEAFLRIHFFQPHKVERNKVYTHH